ncbi:MAG: GPP34 family phosphoprotein, partial [Nocardioidaceae bacterium]
EAHPGPKGSMVIPEVVELSLIGRVDLDDRRRMVVRDPSPTGDELLDRALATVRRKAGKKPSAVINELGKKLRGELAERLAATGVLRAEKGKVLGIFPTTAWPTSSADHEAAVRRSLTSALVEGTTPEPRDGALVALLHALRATHKVVDPKAHDLRRKELDRRAKEIAEGSWGSQAVRDAIDAMMAAVTVAVMTSTIAATAGSG